ncbi:MAG: hypothetical protein LBB58_02420 [Cellulomonadaceae bacterium]|jgi:hypothetical protein|nr:hypothetical protein [Cellulomonadaceae bacterium]
MADLFDTDNLNFFPDGGTRGKLQDLLIPQHVVAAETAAVTEPTVVTTLGRRVDLPYGDTAAVAIHNGEAQYVGLGQVKASSQLEADVTLYHTHWFQKTVRIPIQKIEEYNSRGLPWFESMTRDMIRALPRAMDYAFIHGIDARSGAPVKALTPAVHDSPVVFNMDGATVYDGLDAAQQALYGRGLQATGVALDSHFGGALATARWPLTGQRIYPEFNPRGTSLLEGLKSVVSPAVGARGKEQAPKPFEPLAGIVGDWSTVEWDIVRPAILQYFTSGDPDNSGRDLAAYNEVAWRIEIAYAWGYKRLDQFALLTGSPQLGGVGVSIPNVERIDIDATRVEVAQVPVSVAAATATAAVVPVAEAVVTDEPEPVVVADDVDDELLGQVSETPEPVTGGPFASKVAGKGGARK